LNLDFRRTNKLAKSHILFDNLINAEVFHLLYITCKDGFEEIDRVYIHGKHLAIDIREYESSLAAIGIGVHIVFLMRQQPGEVSAREAELLQTERFYPAKHLIVVAFGKHRHKIVEETQETFSAYCFTRKQIAADNANVTMGEIEKV